jgi:wobble nucleotide-excising tRNase
MEIDLQNEELFEDNEIEFGKQINFVFGKNGVGKSTITRLIVDQCKSYDVRLFQGFEGVIDENKLLNAVVLGQENIEINKKITEKEKEKEKKKQEKEEILKKITDQGYNTKNLWTDLEEAKKIYNGKVQEIRKFLTDSAAKIKKATSPQISIPNYDYRNFENEIKEAKLLQDVEIESNKEILKSEIKEAKVIRFPKTDLNNYLEEANEIMETRIEEEILITRLSTSAKKKFAEIGLECHKIGDVCSFCGNDINERAFSELETYFSASKVKNTNDLIDVTILKIGETLEKVKYNRDFKEDFYPEYQDKASDLQLDYTKLLNEWKEYLESLMKALEEKKKNIFGISENIKLEVPTNFENIQNRYDELSGDNNNSDLSDMQGQAKDELRYHYIKKLLEEFEYTMKKKELLDAEGIMKKYENNIRNENDKITSREGIDFQIKSIKEEIGDLKFQTKDEKKLAEIINEKLKFFVTFKLEHANNDSGEGHYYVVNLRTNEKREITKLSTGEKNIIAFIYFIEKLNEVSNIDSNLKKIILFDDPMSSNDDTMQYIIIEELSKLMKNEYKFHKTVILTHNCHFYINVKYGFSYKKSNFIRLTSKNKKTYINYITDKNEDFKTSYEFLWKELKLLNSEENLHPESLLNPMRRIIETYTKFNGINKNTFYQKVVGSKKLFDVNSHSIDDLEADLNGKTKDQIIDIFKNCFIESNATEHLNMYWLD